LLRRTDEDEFRAFATVRIPGLRRSAYLLCGDAHAADDLVSTVLIKLYRNWRRLATVDHPDAYVRRVLVTSWTDELRRPWRRERTSAVVPDPPPHHDAYRLDRFTLMPLLARLTPKRRAVVVLRFYEDLSVEQTAEIMRCSPGTVKTHTHRALEDLRKLLPEALGRPGSGRSTSSEGAAI
jgi:RNA polymerase sigma-70 factor (sigma-E family)